MLEGHYAVDADIALSYINNQCIICIIDKYPFLRKYSVPASSAHSPLAVHP